MMCRKRVELVVCCLQELVGLSLSPLWLFPSYVITHSQTASLTCSHVLLALSPSFVTAQVQDVSTETLHREQIQDFRCNQAPGVGKDGVLSIRVIQIG